MTPEELLREASYVTVIIPHHGSHATNNNSRPIILVAALSDHLNKIDARKYVGESAVLMHHQRN